MSQTHYIYALVDPRDGDVRYIGKSVDPKQRLRKHIHKARKENPGNLYRYDWICSVLSDGYRPILEIIEEVSEDGWREAERTWIKYGREQGWPLTNIENGGCGPGMVSKETKELISQSVKKWIEENGNPFEGQKHTEKTKKLLSRKAKERYRKNPDLHPSNRREYGPRPESVKKQISETHKKKGVNRGAKNGQAKLTKKKVREIRRKYETGEYYQYELAEKYNVSDAHISDIVNYKKWKHI